MGITVAALHGASHLNPLLYMDTHSAVHLDSFAWHFIWIFASLIGFGGKED